MEIFEGSRSFDIVFGTITGLACLSVAVPILWWSLPSHRRRLFSTAVDPRGYLQIAYGVFCMAMAWADALCRYIPHRPLGMVHPSFFATTLIIVFVIGPRVVTVATNTGATRTIAPPNHSRRTGFVLAGLLACLAMLPLTSLWYAFGPPDAAARSVAVAHASSSLR